MLKDPDLEEGENPIGPAAICDAYKEACKDLDMDIEIKLLLLKLFDKHVVDEIVDACGELNQYLIGQDILPHIKTEIKRTPSREGPPHAATGGSEQNPRAQALGTHFLGEAGPMSGVSAPATGNQFPANPFAVTGPMIGGVSSDADNTSPAPPTMTALGMVQPQAVYNTVQQVMRLNSTDEPTPTPISGQVLSNLTALQSGDTGLMGAAAATLSEEQLNDGASNVLHHLKHANVAQGMNQVDDVMIDVVAMMFDYILDDKNIPAIMKALIGRLQIPLLKVAILDKGFFARKFHPARKLLNQLAETALGWSEDAEGAPALHQKVESIVQRVLSEFQDDVAIFSEVLADLESFLEAEEQAAQETTSRSTQLIEGRERLANAKSVVDKTLAQRTESVSYPFVARFLEEHWGNLLTTAYVKDGENSDVWRETIDVMDDLLWSIAPKPIHEDRVRLVSLLPSLLKRIKEGMSRIGVAEERRDRFLKKLAKVHLTIIRPDALEFDREEHHETVSGIADEPPAVDSELEAEEPDEEIDDEQEAGEERVDPEATTQEIGTEWSLRVGSALEQANRVIFQTAEDKPPCKGMGTTAVTAVFHEGFVTIGHVGDSRMYRWRDKTLSQLTSDHSLRQEMVDKGFYTPERAEQEIASNIVTRALGAEATVQPTVQELETRPDDLYLLCSDGLTDMVEDQPIAELLAGNHGESLEATAEKLVANANENGGRDNISVTLVKVLVLESLDIFEGVDPNDPLEIASLTDVGLRRSHNEDAVGDAIDEGIVVLADGMGGCNAGEVASALAIEEVLKKLRSEETVTDAHETATEAAPSGINFPAINALFEDEPEATEAVEDDDDIDVGDGGGVEMIAAAGRDADDRAGPDHYVRIVRDLEVGAWVEFCNQDGSHTRARLAWISASSDNYLFTNRQGHKVVESSPLGLAVELREGNARALDNVPLFDRALGNLMTRIRGSETG